MSTQRIVVGIVLVAALGLGLPNAWAQVAVFDAATTARNAVTLARTCLS